MRIEGKFNSQTEKRRLTCKRSAAPWLCSRAWIKSCSIGEVSNLGRCADNFSAVDCSPVMSASIDCSFGNVRRAAIVKAIKLPL